MRIYLLSCETVENGGGIYAYDFTENGALKPLSNGRPKLPIYIRSLWKRSAISTRNVLVLEKQKSKLISFY